MRTGAIFARGSCRALKWMALFGVMFALGAGTAAAQLTVEVDDEVHEGDLVTLTVGGTVDIGADAAAAVLTVTASAGTADASAIANVTDGEGNDYGTFSTARIDLPEGGADGITGHSVNGTFTWQVGSDLDAENELVTLTFTATGATAPSATPIVTIDDDETQSFVWIPAAPTLKEGGTANITLRADPLPVQLTHTVTLVVDAGYATRNPADDTDVNTHLFNVTAPEVALLLKAPANDGNRDDDMITLQARDATVNPLAELSINVEDIHGLPDATAITAKAYDMMTGGNEVMSVEEGGTVYLEVMVDRGTDGYPMGEAIDVALSLSDSTLGMLEADMVTVPTGTGVAKAPRVMLTTEVMDSLDDGTLVVSLTASGTTAANGPVGSAMGTPFSLMIANTTMKNVEPKSAAEVQAVVDAEIADKQGSDGVFTTEDPTLNILVDQLFDLPGVGFDVAISHEENSSSGTAVWVSFEGTSQVNLFPHSPATETVTLTAVVSSTASATVSQNSANSASVTFDVTVHPVPTPTDPPDAPGEPQATVPNDQSGNPQRGMLDVWWTKPADNGSVILDYSLQYRVKGSPNWTVMSAPIPAIDYPVTTLSGLLDGTTYEFQVRARNANGMSGWSPIGEGMTLAAPVLPDLKGQITAMKLTGGVTEKNIGGVTRVHVTEGATDVKLEVTVQWTHEEISALYGAGTTADPAVIDVLIKGHLASQQTSALPNWVSWIDDQQDAHFPDSGGIYDGSTPGRLMVKIPKKPKATEFPYSQREVRSSTASITLLILEDDAEAENDAFYVETWRSPDVDLNAGSAVNRVTPIVVIEDNDEQKVTVKKGTSSGPTKVYENADTSFTIAASPARVDLPLDVRLDMLDLSGVTVSAAKISLSTAAVTLNADRSGSTAGNKADVTVHLPASDGDRKDDHYDLQASVVLYSLSAGGYEPIAVASHKIDVLDIHKLPPLMVSPASGMVDEGDEIELTLTVDRNPHDTIATSGSETRQYTAEALTIAVMAGGTASASDYTMTPSAITVDAHNKKAPWTQEVKVKIAATDDEDIDAETLMLDFVVNGTVAANGPRPDDAPAYDAQASLTIQDATAALVSVRENAYDVIKAALGDPPMLMTGMSGELMGANLFDYDSSAVTVAYGTSVEGGAVTASASGGTVTIMGAMAGEAKVTITATATPNSSSLIVNQTKANVAQLTFPVMVEDPALTFTVMGPDEMNLTEGGMGGMVTVMTNRAVSENTEVMLMRDGSSSASEDDYMLDPPLVTIMAGDMEGHTMVMAVDDNMAEDMEMLTLFLVVDGMQMSDQSVSFYLWDAAVPALPIIAQLLLAAFLAIGGYRRYLRR